MAPAGDNGAASTGTGMATARGVVLTTSYCSVVARKQQRAVEDNDVVTAGQSLALVATPSTLRVPKGGCLLRPLTHGVAYLYLSVP